MSDLTKLKEVHIRISNDAPKADPKSKLQHAPALIAAVASITAAIIAGVASYSTSVTRTKLEQKIEAERQKTATELNSARISTERLIAEKQQDTASEIAALKVETEERIANSQASIDKAKTFAGLVRQISEPNESTVALLALWKLYPEEEERKIALAAALAVRNEESLKAIAVLGDDVQPYLEGLRESKNTELAEAASTALTALSPKTESAYLIRKIEASDRPNPFNELIKSLIKSAQQNEDVRDEIASYLKKPDRKHEVAFRYVLYAAGDRERIHEILDPILKDPGGFAEVADILRFGDYQESDWPAILGATLAFLESGADATARSTAFDILDDHSIDRKLIDLPIQDRIVKACYNVTLNNEAYTYSRYYGLESLHEWSPKHALSAISRLLANGESDLNLLQMAERIITGEMGKTSPRKVFDSIKIPDARAGAEQWKKWRDDNVDFLTSIEEDS